MIGTLSSVSGTSADLRLCAAGDLGAIAGLSRFFIVPEIDKASESWSALGMDIARIWNFFLLYSFDCFILSLTFYDMVSIWSWLSLMLFMVAVNSYLACFRIFIALLFAWRP